MNFCRSKSAGIEAPNFDFAPNVARPISRFFRFVFLTLKGG